MKLPKVNFQKMDGLIPAVIQDERTNQVLMLGYMNQEALAETIKTNKITFWSRSKKRLWQKGEKSGNFLTLKKVFVDCDQDALLFFAKPEGPTCHTGERSCFGTSSQEISFLNELTRLIEDRKQERPEGSYTSVLFNNGIKFIGSKVEEEAEEVVVAARTEGRERLAEESADLLFHLLVLLSSKSLSLEDIVAVLKKRNGA